MNLETETAQYMNQYLTKSVPGLSAIYQDGLTRGYEIGKKAAQEIAPIIIGEISIVNYHGGGLWLSRISGEWAGEGMQVSNPVTMKKLEKLIEQFFLDNM